MSISQLKEYHDRYRSSDPPTYTFQQNAQTKQFIAICQYRNQESVGYGFSKKESQRAAADKMLAILDVRPNVSSIESIQKTLPFKATISQMSANSSRSKSTSNREMKKEFTEDQKEKAFRFLAEYRDEDPNSDARKSMAPDQCVIDQVDMGLKSDDAPKSDTLLTLSEYKDAIDVFKQIMKEMKLKFFCKVPEIKRDAESEHIVLIQICYKIHLLTGGTGFSIEAATYAACEKAIKMLRIYTS